MFGNIAEVKKVITHIKNCGECTQKQKEITEHYKAVESGLDKKAVLSGQEINTDTDKKN